MERSGGRGERSASRSSESRDQREERLTEVCSFPRSISSDAYEDHLWCLGGDVGALSEESRSGRGGLSGEACFWDLEARVEECDLSECLELLERDFGGVATRSRGLIGKAD